jgi:NADP-dependent 3-hydroxy acid dehydrogenase YdfG
VSKVCITGTTRGIGQAIAEHFKQLEWEVVELNRGDAIIESGIGCDLFINNAYINGHQIDIFNQLYASVAKMVVIGSIASDYPDPEMPAYSQHKRELKERVLEVANSSAKKADILLLQLTGESYNDPQLITRTIDFWLEYPKVNCIAFKPGTPNR